MPVPSIFAALGDATRLKLVAVLYAGGVFSIAQLTANADISRRGVTKHLQVPAAQAWCETSGWGVNVCGNWSRRQ